MHYKGIIFDFDGTLVDSNKIKIDAYYRASNVSKDHVLIVSEILQEFSELNRYDTFSKIVNKLSTVGVVLEYEKVVQLFSKIVLDEIIVANGLDYAVSILEALMLTDTVVYLSSNTPKVILDQIIKEKNWTKYFKRVYGYPSSKQLTLEEIIKENNFATNEYLVVGDGFSDEHSARLNKTDFFKVGNKSLEELAHLLNIKV